MPGKPTNCHTPVLALDLVVRFWENRLFAFLGSNFSRDSVDVGVSLTAKVAKYIINADFVVSLIVYSYKYKTDQYIRMRW